MSESISISEAARRLGVDRKKVSAALTILDLPTGKVSPHNRTKLIDERTLRTLMKRLNVAPTARATA